MTAYGTSSHLRIGKAISGSGSSVVIDTSEHYTNVKAKEVEFGIDFKSKISNNAGGRSRLTPDLKWAQSFKIAGAVLLGGGDVNGTTEWISESYIAKTPIYAVIEMPPATGSTYLKKTWYNDSLAKVYYLKGVLGKLSIKERQGRLLKISFDFKSAWKP